MHTYSPPELCLRGRRRHVSGIYRRLFSFLLACLFIACLAPSFRSSADSPVSEQLGQTTTKKPESPAYDCAGDIPYSHIEGHKLIEKAIDEALKLLGKCESCRRMFSDDPDFAINLLKRMRQDKAIIISEAAPVRFKLSGDGKRLKVYESQKLADSAAVTQDVADPKARSKSPIMVKPCIYINPKQFIATGETAYKHPLFPLSAPVDGAVAILHELAHVARVIALDGPETEETRKKSGANTDCVRRNCDSCEFFECPGAPPRRPAARKKS